MDDKKPIRLPVKSATTGMTVALMSIDGLQLWDKRTRQWETFTLESLIEMHTRLQQRGESTRNEKQERL